MKSARDRVAAAETNACVALCLYCNKPFNPRTTGGKAQLFCSREHLREYHRSLEQTIAELIEKGFIAFRDGRWLLTT
jgi:hypothetical protein